MWTETRNSSHKPAEKQNCLCLAIYQLIAILFIYLFISQELQEAQILAVCWVRASQVTKERGKGGEEYQGALEGSFNTAGKVEQILL